MTFPSRVPGTTGVVALTAILTLGASPALHAQVSTSQTSQPLSADSLLPGDPAVTVGTLPNGLRYYIRVNKKPEHRAELRLVVKAGSLMEDDDQRGVAHFVEHMAFRGSQHFQGTDMVEYLKSIGVAFGADLNANTDFAQTIYILPVPTDTAAQVAKAIQILGDWAHGVTFPQKDIDEERGIILSERRTDLGVEMRMMEQLLPKLLKGSRYPDRLPIGTEASVQGMTRDRIVRFYQKWYRPDRMAVIAVGDFDGPQMERMIREQFSAIPRATEPLQDPTFPIPHQSGTQVVVARDPEMPATAVSLMYRDSVPTKRTVGDQRDVLVRTAFEGMINDRLAEITRKPNAPFLGAGVSHEEITRGVQDINITTAVMPNGALRGADAVLSEVARVDRQGFTQTELDRTKQSLLTTINTNYDNRNDRQSAEFVDKYIENFLDSTAFSDITAMTALNKRLIESVALADVNREAHFWNRPNDRAVVVMQPVTATPPDTTALLGLFTTVANRTIAAYNDKVDKGPLVDHPPTAGHVVSEKKYPDVGVTQWTLSNGATVFLKPTTLKSDEILLHGMSRGGSSIFPDDAFPSAAVLNDVAGTFGAGRFSNEALGKKLSDKVANVSLGIDDNHDIVEGSSNRRDVETMFQLLWLRMTAPRYDSAEVVAWRQRQLGSIVDRSRDPNAIFLDTVSATLSNHSIRSPLPSAALYEHADPARAFSLYKDRFADASNFAFVIAGTFNADSIKPLVERYIGGLPTLHRNDHAHDRPEYHPPVGVTTKTVTAGQDPKSTTILNFNGSYQPSAEASTHMDLLAGVLENRLENRLREQLAWTYGVGVSPSRVGPPIGTYDIAIQFVADPVHRDSLVKETFAIVNSLRQTPPSADELQRVVAPKVRELQNAQQENGSWLEIASMYELGRPFTDILNDSLMRATTPAQIQQAAQQYLNLSQYQEFDLVPASTATAAAPAAQSKP